MQSFNPELKVGEQAMIIGVHNQKNAHKIGKIVVIEGLANAGEVCDDWFTEIHMGVSLKYDLALVSGIGDTPGIVGGFSIIQQKYLMPLPPLEDPSIDDCTFTPIVQKENAKCW